MAVVLARSDKPDVTAGRRFRLPVMPEVRSLCRLADLGKGSFSSFAFGHFIQLRDRC